MGQRAEKAKRRANKASDSQPRQDTPDPATQKTPQWVFWVGFAALLVAIVPTLMLVLSSFNMMSLSGCGVDEGCGKAQRSDWAKIPGILWPVSHVGLAYFMAMAIGWILFAGERMTHVFIACAILGGTASGMYLVVIAANINSYFCPYCITAHLANFVFLTMVLISKPAPAKVAATATSILATLASVFLVTTGILFGVSKTVESAIEADRLEQAADSVNKILDGGGEAMQGFVGRYVRGATPAKVRLVMFTGYQCPDCQRIEHEVNRILATRDDVSVSIKQFPLNSDCNGNMGSAMHKNACWAARAAETAGILRGAAGFWQMHDRLFAMKGEFNESQLVAVLQEFSYNVEQFINTMKSEQTLELVRNDTREGGEMLVVQTPTIYINGVEFKGVEVNGALTNAVNEIAANVKETGAATDDKPLDGPAKMIADWEKENVPILYPRADAVHYGAPHDSAKLRIVVWGDYQSVHCKKMDAMCRKRVEDQEGVSYTFIYFPLNLDCNTRIGKTRFENACHAVKAVHAARHLGGHDVMMQMHESLFAALGEQDTVTVDVILNIGEDLGLDRNALHTEIRGGRYDTVVQQDVLDAAKRNVRGIPMLLVNDKRLLQYAYQKEPRPDFVFDYIMGPVDGE